MNRPFPSLSALAAALASRPHPQPAGVSLEAAVMVNLLGNELLLVRRQVLAGDKWSGHMGLPGGRHEPEDATLLDTARRETREEVGFDPRDHGTVLGPLGTYVAAHWVDLDTLVAAHGTAAVRELGDPVPAYVPDVEGEQLVVWGITYGILERLRALA